METQQTDIIPGKEQGAFTVPGQPLATQMLRQVLASGRLSRAYLFLGPVGTGKQAAAEHFARVILGGDIQRIQERIHPDLVWIEPTVKVGKNLVPYSELAARGDISPAKAVVRIEQIRAVQTRTRLQPLEAERTVVVIGADRLKETSANALLKVIEESGPTLFILITAQRPLDTIASRCQMIPFHPVSLVEHQRLLQAQCPAANHPLLVRLTQGRPSETIKAYRALLPLGDLKPLLDKDTSAASRMAAASQISALPSATQIWLLRIAQWQYATERPEVLEQVQTALQALQSYVSPLLVWDVFLGHGAIPILPDLEAAAELPTSGGRRWDEWNERESGEGSEGEQLSLAIAPVSSPAQSAAKTQRQEPEPEQQTGKGKKTAKKGKSAPPRSGEQVIPLFG